MKIKYYGTFFDEEESKKLHELDSKTLDVIPDNLHVTFRYLPYDSERIDDIVGRKIKIRIIGKANDGKNSALLVEIPEEYKKYYIHRYEKDGKTIRIIPHITLSFSKDSSAMASRYLDFKPLDNYIEVEGKFGYFLENNQNEKDIVVFDKVQ